MTSLQYLNDQPFRLKYDPAIHQERRPASRKSSILQTSTSISIILSMLNSTGMFPYLLIIAFLFNVYRNRFYLAAERVKKFAFGRKAYHSQSLSGVASSEHLNKLSRVSSTDTIRKLSKSIRKSFDNFTQRVALQAITRKECFARLNYIECISISDLLIIFRYATDVNQVDFDKKKFMEEQSQQVRAMVTAMDMAVSISRGGAVEGARVTGTREKGDIDALYFVAAVRVFAEWRTLRLVPEGYNRSAVALGLAYRDVLQNLVKIESGVHGYLKHYGGLESNDGKPITSPTLRQVLQYEITTNAHKKLPKLQEQSAASGLLWTKRQVHYQNACFLNSLAFPFRFDSVKDAMSAAYKEVYDEYHGWAIKQVFLHSFAGSPPVEKIWEAMEPPEQVLKDESNFEGCSQKQYQNVPQRTLSDVSEEEEDPDNEFLMALENFGHQVADKWLDLLGLFNCLSDEEKKKRRAQNLILSSESFVNLNEIEDSLIKVMRSPGTANDENDKKPVDKIEQVKAGTAAFVEELRPLLQELSDMLDELNMNDPSRV